jgi:penicillin amidase
MGAADAAPAIFETLYLHFIRCTFADELGNELFERYNGTTSVSRIATDQLINAGASPWFDDKETTNEVETMEDAVVCAFTGAVAELVAKMGNNPDTWHWGDIHQLVLAHPMASVKVLDRVFSMNRGPFPLGGSFHTVSPYSYDAGKPFDVNHGSSHRHIFDLDNWDNSLTVIPTGNSGIPASDHYCDQTALYIRGKYHADYFTRELIENHARYRRIFECAP